MLRRRVLIVVSSYRPMMLADMQRARMLAWELPKLGWDVEVLAPKPKHVRQDAREPNPDGFFCPGVSVHEFCSLGRWLFGLFGSYSLGWSTLWPLYQRGNALLSENGVDLVYFSTTMFVYCYVGMLWRKRFGIPYVLDFHDPWLKVEAQGASWKARLRGWLTMHMERAAVANADGLVSVSPQYVQVLRSRYERRNPRWMNGGRCAEIPFSSSERDLIEVRGSAESVGPERRDELLIQYVGVGGAIMERSFRLICRALEFLRSQGGVVVDRVRVRLFGTTYGWRCGDARLLEEVALSVGVGDLVREMPERVSYRQSLKVLLESDGVLILGVDDAGYMPSKLFTYALSGKPVLAALRYDGPAFAHFIRAPALGHALWFDDSHEMDVAEAARVVGSFLQEVASRQQFDRRELLQSYSAAAMAQEHVRVFEACLE